MPLCVCGGGKFCKQWHYNENLETLHGRLCPPLQKVIIKIKQKMETLASAAGLHAVKMLQKLKSTD